MFVSPDSLTVRLEQAFENSVFVLNVAVLSGGAECGIALRTSRIISQDLAGGNGTNVMVLLVAIAQ
jgi:hypothetical protein